MTLNVIVACDLNFGIGLNNRIPWYIPEDLKYFKNTTINKTVIMGKKTFESLNYKPLPNRKNIVVTSSNEILSNDPKLIILDINKTREYIDTNKNKECIFVIGGEKLYNEFVDECDYIYLTQIYVNFNCDKKFSFVKDDFTIEWSSDIFTSNKQNKYQYYRYKRS
jgi:dihydrofolate reductase